MYTFSHYFITAAINSKIRRRRESGLWFILGGVFPDAGIYSLSLIWWAGYRFISGWSNSEIFSLMYDELFFKNPVWIFGYNCLHSPLVIAAALSLCLMYERRFSEPEQERLIRFRGFLLACGLHSLIDILTHHNDGPLLLYPLNSELRFYSPVSYWDRNYHASEFFLFEMCVNVFCIVWLIFQRIKPGISGQRRVNEKEK